MSAFPMAWAFNATGVRPTEKLVLIHLADNTGNLGQGDADNDVTCLQMDQLCRFALCDSAQAGRALGALERRGLIDRSGGRIRLKVTNAVRPEARHAQ